MKSNFRFSCPSLIIVVNTSPSIIWIRSSKPHALLFFFNNWIALKLRSIKTQFAAPLLTASSPKEPVPENKSNTCEPAISWLKKEKRNDFTCPVVGRNSNPDGPLNFFPRFTPPKIRTMISTKRNGQIQNQFYFVCLIVEIIHRYQKQGSDIAGRLEFFQLVEPSQGLDMIAFHP